MAARSRQAVSRPRGRQDAPLTERERDLLNRLLSDPTYFPVEYRAWLKSFIEGAGLQFPASTVTGAARPPGVGTAFPTSPYDGQQFILTDSLTNPSYKWLLIYNAQSSSPYKWEFIGGSPLLVQGITGSNATNVATAVGAGLTVPRAGDYEFDWGGTIEEGTAWNHAYDYLGNGTISLGPIQRQRASTDNSSAETASMVARANGVAASSVWRHMLANSNETQAIVLSTGFIRCRPFRVS